jgi:hypothetical protein
MEVTAILLALALIAGSAIFADGFDVKNVKLNTQNVWVLQKGTGTNLASRFGRVNTEVNELTSFNAVTDPSELVQNAFASMLFAGANTKYVNISSSSPADFTEDSEDSIALDSSAKSIDVGESVAAMISADGRLLVSEAKSNIFLKPEAVAFPAGVEKFDACAVTASQRVKAFSSVTKRVYEFNPITQSWADATDVVTGVASGIFQMASVRDKWVLLDQTGGKLWVSGAGDAVAVEANAQLQRSSITGSSAYLASTTGLFTVALDTRDLTQVQAVEGGLITTRPITFKYNVYGTWLAESEGWFYSSGDQQLKPLDYATRKLDVTKLTGEGKDALAFQSTGETAVINDTYSGWAWSLPTGDLIVGTQNWNSIVPPPKPCKVDCKQPEDAKTPKPPVAVADRFGVRAGELVSLPVLLNDSDPNRGNIITIVPNTVRGLSSNFGEVKVTSEQQMLTVLVSDLARGTQTFTYKITDGTGTSNSNSAKVTLTIIPDNKNSPPGWCSDVIQGCVQVWPEASVSPGSEISMPFLNGWIDPEGDRFFISKASIVKGEGNLAFTPAGQLVYQNTSAGEKRASMVTTSVTVSDINGASSTVEFAITVRPETVFSFAAPVVVIGLKEPTTVDFKNFTSGAQGFVSISNLAASKGDTLNFEQLDHTRVRFTATDSKPSQLLIKLRDSSGSEVDSLFRVNVVESSELKLSTTPVTVLVSPGLDTSIDVFSAAHNPANRALVISQIKLDPYKGALLSAEKIKGGNLRIRGKNVNDTPGLVGVISYTLSDGGSDPSYKTEGQAFVYEMERPADQFPPVARRDSVTIRAGQSTEVDVLANDLGKPGVPLAIDSRSLIQEESTTCIKGGLIFAGSGKIRIVAPPNQGIFRCDYSIFAANNPSQKTIATIAIKVVQNDDANQAPVAYDLAARVRAGETVTIPVITSGVDPDGDSVLVQSLAEVRGNKGAAYINPDGSSIEYTALSNARGQDRFTYMLVDSQGVVSASATVKVAIIGGEPDTAPVTLNDYAEVVIGAGNKVIMDPLANDFDPQPNPDKPMSLVKNSVIPDISEKSDNFKLWKSAIKVDGNRVTVKAGLAKMEMRFIYTAQSSSGSRSPGYLIVKSTDEAINDAPDVTDTFATRAQATEFVSGGLDVVSKKVIWTSGDVGALKLSFWGDATGYRIVDNLKVAGAEFPKNQKIVIFKLSGTNFAGKEVSSYGFLHLPGTKPKITFDPSASKQKVDEGKSVTFDMAELTNLQTGLTIGDVKAYGVRENATCKVKSGTEVTYTAGLGAPWSDFCDVDLKLAGSGEAFITLLVPIEITPLEPQPELTNQQITIVPGTSSEQIYDLINMTNWNGKTDQEKSKLKYSYSGGGNIFTIEQKPSGSSKLNIKAYGSATPGTKKSIRISLDAYPNTKPANLVLVVGQLPNELPVAPTLTLDCSLTTGEDACVVTSAQMNSAPGTYNPYSGEEELRFAPFGYTTGAISYENGSRACGKVSIKSQAERIYAVWANKPTGVRCTVPYSVLDREGRVGLGSLEFSFSGIPANVASVSQVDYTASTVTLQIVPPASSFPAITEFEVTDETGETIGCEIDNSGGATRCVIYNLTPYDGLADANLHTYSVKARNDQGLSEKAKVANRVYSFKAPKRVSPNNIDAITVYDPEATETRGFADVTVLPLDDTQIERYEITGDAGLNPVVEMTSNTLEPFTIRVAAKPGKRSRITVTAFGRVAPPVRDVSDSNSSNWVGRIAAKPKIEDISVKLSKSGSSFVAQIKATNIDKNWSESPLEVAYGMYTGNTPPVCTWDSGSNELTMSVEDNQSLISSIKPVDFGFEETQKGSISSSVLKPILDNTSYTPYVCFANSFGYTKMGGVAVSTLSDPAATAFAYDISATPNSSGAWLVSLGRSEAKPGVKVQFNSTSTDAGWSDSISSDTFGAKPTIRVRYCLLSDPTTCSNGTRKIEPISNSRSWQMKITGIDKLIDLTLIEADPNVTGEVMVCTKNHDIDFKLLGSGLATESKKPLWQISGTPTYISTSNTTGDLEKPGDNWRIPNRPPVKSISVQFSGNLLNSHVKGLTGTVTHKFTCDQ